DALRAADDVRSVGPQPARSARLDTGTTGAAVGDHGRLGVEPGARANDAAERRHGGEAGGGIRTRSGGAGSAVAGGARDRASELTCETAGDQSRAGDERAAGADGAGAIDGRGKAGKAGAQAEAAMSCPSPEDLLARVIAGEDVPHLDECEDCAWYVDAVYHAAKVFDGNCEELRRAVAELVDEALEDVPSKEWVARLVAEWGSYNSLVIAELLRRADRAYENPSIAVDLTSAAVALCEAKVKAGTPPPAQLRFDALKEHAMALRAANDLNGSLEALVRASAVASELENREQMDAVVALCTALTYSEADLGKL